MPLAVFDLDDTLIDGDSSSLWLRYLVQQQLAPPEMVPEEAAMMEAYRRGELDMDQYMAFTLQPLKDKAITEVTTWVEDFIRTQILPRVFPDAERLLADYKDKGWTIVVISATGEHLVGPIARYLGADDSLAIQLACHNGCYRGETQGVMTYREGKVIRLQQWLAAHSFTLTGSHGYSDSVNDVPLLEAVETAFVVNPDTRLAEIAKCKEWASLSWHRG